MLAHLPDKLWNGVPFSFASRIVKLVEVAPSLGRVRSRLSMEEDTERQLIGEEEGRRGRERGVLEAYSHCCSKCR